MKKQKTSDCNYQKQLDRILNSFNINDSESLGLSQGTSDGNKGSKKKLLLHACCAPCSSAVLEYLNKYFDITLFFYNPNISTLDEFTYRASELRRLVKELGYPAKIIEAPYCHQEFLDKIKGLESEPERGRRCSKCFELRLSKTADEALKSKEEYDYFCTTLTISPLKDAKLLNELGQKTGEEYGLAFLPSDFKKRGRYQRSIELSKKYGLYRQNFCGCEFSKRS